MEEVRFFAKGSIDSSTVNAENKSIMTLAAFGTKRLLDLVASFYWNGGFLSGIPNNLYRY